MSPKSAKSGKSAKSAKSSASGKTVNKKPALPERQLDTISQVSQALSRSTSLNEKLQLLRNSDLNESEKMELLQKSLGHKDWKAIHGRARTRRPRMTPS